MKVALLGLMQSGKSTLVSAISGREAGAGGGAQIVETVVPVPDERLDWLTTLYEPKKTVYATIECADVPGLSFIDSAGRAAARRLFDQVRTVDMLVLVVRAFEDAAAPPSRGQVDAAADLAELQTELMLADLQIVCNRIERLEKDVLKPTEMQTQHKAELALHGRLQQGIESGKTVRSLIDDGQDHALIKSLGLLTLKPIMVVVNIGEDQLGEAVNVEGVIEDDLEIVPLCAKLESELAQLDADSRAEFMADLGIEEPATNRFVQSCYAAMGLISFLTVGKDEVRAWPIRRDTPAVEAAGKVHSDIQRGFIRAETFSFDDLRELGGEKAVRAAGKARLEGKEYVVQDGDIIDFRFSV